MKNKSDQPIAADPSEGSRRTPDSNARGGTRWTPGPWRVDEHAEILRGAILRGAMGTTRGTIRATGAQGEAIIANCWQYSDVEDRDECLANAQLIAAAPDLYEALEALAIATASADNPADQGVGSYGPEMRAARAALAKARGETASDALTRESGAKPPGRLGQ